MKKPVFLSCMLAILAIAALMNSCKKKEDDTDTQSAQDNALAEETFNDVNNIANQAYTNGGTGLSTYKVAPDNPTLLSGCASVSLTPDSISGGNIAVNFGTTPCICLDGRYRKGIINIHYTGPYRDSGSVNTITFQDYYVGAEATNMFKVNGTKTVSNRGHNSAGHLWYSISVNGQILNTSGQTLSWTSQREREWIGGEGTAAWFDDEYLISGSASGTSFAGTSFTLNIIQPLHIKLDCFWIKDGVFDFIPAGKPTRTVNYGSGTCDNDATVTINGTIYNIKLR